MSRGTHRSHHAPRSRLRTRNTPTLKSRAFTLVEVLVVIAIIGMVTGVLIVGTTRLIDACRYYAEKLNRRIFFEWTLIDGQNDTEEHAHAIGRLLTGIQAQINLIPLNPTNGYNGAPGHAPAAKKFQAVLATYNIPSTVRQRRGIDIAAGCGQLATPDTK